MSRRLVTPEEMSLADQRTIASGTPAEVLMDRAGRAIARAAIRVAGGRYGKRALVLCGKGNNGGDGFVAARALAGEGLAVRVLLLSAPAEIDGAARHHLEALGRARVRLDVWTSSDRGLGDEWDVVVDAIFGTGFRGAPIGPPADAIECYGRHPRVVAADIPSGVNGATGAVEGDAMRASVTVALAAQKVGTAVPPGSLYAGEVEVADIGIDADASLGDEPVFRLALSSDVEHRLLQLRAPDAHKRASPVVILAGSDAMRGAALLAARGAARMGSGYVTLGCTEAVKDAAAVRVPEALATVVTEGDHLGPESLDRLAEVIDGAEALAIGPGLGRGPDQSALVERAVRELDVPLVLDADALTALEGKTEWLSEREHITVVTPHPGELARLLGRSTKEVAADRLRAARDLHRLLGPASSFVVKGHRSITGGGLWDVYTIVPTGGPELATAGTGDVLTGAIAATMRRHVPDPDEPGASVEPPDVLTPAYVHGLAGTIAGERVGPSGVVAWDVAEALPEAVQRITGRLT